MKAADEEVQRMFKNMTPAVVTQLIKQGINPLEMKISDLNRVAEQVRSEVGKDDNQKFSEYLYKLEKNNQITEEERNSYIGIYRLIHQVEQTDGAAIFSRSSFSMIAPVGLFGNGSTNNFVFGVIAASNSSGVRRN